MYFGIHLYLTSSPQMFRGRQVSADLCDPQAQTRQGEMPDLCERCRSWIPSKTVPGAVFYQELCSQFGAAIEYKVRFLCIGDGGSSHCINLDSTLCKSSTRESTIISLRPTKLVESMMIKTRKTKMRLSRSSRKARLRIKPTRTVRMRKNSNVHSFNHQIQ
jgi:hypothetical protein